GNGKFGPDDPVTGYEALAMILRAVGYGKMDGEFQGSDWAVQTAARANTLKVTKNVQNSALLNSAATRELVAELLFRSILVPTVEYNQFSGYSENDTTLAYQSFGLERIEGVVVANEYADLYSTQVLNEGKTDLQEANGTIRSLDITSALTDIGESRYAYIIDSAHGAKVLGLEDTGSNVVFEPENGKGTKIEGSNFQKNTGLRKDDDTEFYLNFGREGKFSCDQRLEFQVVFYTEQAYKSFVSNYEDIGAYAYKCQLSAAKDDDWTVERGTFTVDTDNTAVLTRTDKDFSLKDYAFPTTGDNNYVLFNRIVRANEEITAEEMDIIEGIFAAADNILGNGQPRDQVTGDVYLGTKSNIDKDDKERDVSNEISFRKFKDEYINSEIWDQDIENSGNGEWLKVVDYNNDGVAEYAFLTEYTLDKAISSYTKSGETILEFNSMDIENIEDNDGIIDYTEEISVGDVVYYTKIDNRYTITKSPVVKATIQTVTFKDDSCTTTDGETYTESDIDNESRLDQLVANMEDKVEYNLYFDAYGWLRAYELANGNTYGLLTELYRTTSQNVQYVKGEDLTVELKKGDAKIDEFGVDNSKDNVFLLNVNRSGIAANNWANLERDILALSSHAWYKNVYSTSSVEDPSSILLQPAIGQLGLEYAADGRSAETAMRNVTTNVAVYTETADGEVRLTSPVKLAKDVNGNQYYYVNSTLTGEKTTDTSKVVDASGNRLTGNALDARKAYQVDYIELDLSDGVEADAKHYPIADSADNHSRYQYQNGSYNNYVDAVHDTEFYVVNTSTKEKIDHFVDYEKVYALKAEDIVAAYAVARNIESDYNKSDYWVADVIVIEVSNIDAIYDSVGVFYNNPSQTSGNVKRIETLNTESENPEIEMVLDGGRWDWHPRDNGNWAYEIDENEVKDGVLYADSVKEIDKNYNAKGLYAGTVTRMRDIKDRGGYIDVLMSGTTELSALKAADGKPVPAWTRGISVNNDILFAIGATNGASGANTTTRSLRVTYNAITNRLEEQHRIIWGEDKDGHVAFVIDVDFRDGDWCAPSWLTAMDTNGLWYAIASEQVANRAGYTFAEALEAYLGWKAGTVDKADALSIIASAKTHKDTTDKQAAQLKQMEDEING
ncbi:MAG: hypothetical protein HFF79_08075, partial [Oscillospiraceae bacterium]|nr:hypothetical protein [Oscillospiraceae bacterium]